MKSLYNFILESRKLFGELKISRELFKNFMNDAIINYEYDDSEYYDQIKNEIESKYSKHLWSVFKGWCESYLYIQSKMSLDEFYDSISNIPLDRVNRALGAGSSGVVIDNGKYVIKLSYSDKFENDSNDLYNYCYKHHCHTLPHIIKYNNSNWVIMEKLKTNTEKIAEYSKILNKRYNNIPMWSIIADNIEINNLSDFEQEVYNWGIKCKSEMESIKSRFIKWPGDLKANNLGERDNGDIVFFDI